MAKTPITQSAFGLPATGAWVGALAAAAALVLAASLGRAAQGLSGPVVWIEPDPVTRTLQVRGSLEGATLSVTDPATGTEINTPEKLYEHGWLITANGFLQSRMDGFYESTPLFDQMEQSLRFEVSHLYPGVQKLAVQYFDQPYEMASTWGFNGSAQLEGGQLTMLDYVSGRLIRGLGGHDKSSLYELILGQVGDTDKPALKTTT